MRKAAFALRFIDELNAAFFAQAVKAYLIAAKT
jgi:hypothetical protein